MNFVKHYHTIGSVSSVVRTVKVVVSLVLCVCDVSVCGTEGSVGSSLLTLLVEQASLKPSELDAHPVRSNMKQLLRSLDQLCPFEPDRDFARPDYVRSFFDYINTLASVLVRSLTSEGTIIRHSFLHPTLLLHKAQAICSADT